MDFNFFSCFKGEDDYKFVQAFSGELSSLASTDDYPTWDKNRVTMFQKYLKNLFETKFPITCIVTYKDMAHKITRDPAFMISIDTVDNHNFSLVLEKALFKHINKYVDGLEYRDEAGNVIEGKFNQAKSQSSNICPANLPEQIFESVKAQYIKKTQTTSDKIISTIVNVVETVKKKAGRPKKS